MKKLFSAVMESSYRVGLHECRSDGGGYFRAKFSNLLKNVGINHVLTSLYNSKPKGGVERSVCSLKDCLRRDNIKKVTQQKIDETIYLINQHSQDDSGTPAEWFFGRSPRSCLANSLTRFVDHTRLIENRKAKQVELAISKGSLLLMTSGRGITSLSRIF